MQPIPISVKRYPIRLGQFLKLAQVVGDGYEAKSLIQQGGVMVNGALETRRGRQLQPGDTIAVQDKLFTCTLPSGLADF